jgi:hypothetical protein
VQQIPLISRPSGDPLSWAYGRGKSEKILGEYRNLRNEWLVGGDWNIWNHGIL